MQGRALLEGTKNYTVFLVKTAVFPLIWLWAWRLAERHTDTDRNARTKIAAAFAAGIIIAGAGFMVLSNFEGDARASMYGEMDNRLSIAVGESEYQDQVTAIDAADNSIDILTRNLNAARDAGDQANATVFEENLNAAQEARTINLLKRSLLQRNHDFYESIAADIMAQNDASVKQAIDAFLASSSDDMYEHDGIPAADAISWNVGQSESRSNRAFEIKDKAEADMATWMNFLLLPGLIGAFFAPLSMAAGNVLKNAWEPSETVGYKPYPGASMGWFLLLGAFGVPALFFAAWAFWDMDVRSTEGQISL